MYGERRKQVVRFSVECCLAAIGQGALTDLCLDQGPAAWKLRRTLGATGVSELEAILCIVGGGGASLVSTHRDARGKLSSGCDNKKCLKCRQTCPRSQAVQMAANHEQGWRGGSQHTRLRIWGSFPSQT